MFDGADRIWPGPDIGGGAATVLADEAEDFLRQLVRIRDQRLRRSITEATRALARAAEDPA